MLCMCLHCKSVNLHRRRSRALCLYTDVISHLTFPPIKETLTHHTPNVCPSVCDVLPTTQEQKIAGSLNLIQWFLLHMTNVCHLRLVGHRSVSQPYKLFCYEWTAVAYMFFKLKIRTQKYDIQKVKALEGQWLIIL